jgi:hypothetical protein
MVWLDFMAPHRHLVVDVTVTSARINTNASRILHPLATLHWELSMANLMRTSALLLAWHAFGSVDP